MNRCTLCGSNTSMIICDLCSITFSQNLSSKKIINNIDIGRDDINNIDIGRDDINNIDIGRDDIKSFIKEWGCAIRSSDELNPIHLGSWLWGINKGALGMYSAGICSSSIWIFIKHPEIENNVDYTLLHEFGHYISYQLELGHNKYIKDGTKTKDIDYKKEELERLLMEEEYRADTFAARLCDIFELSIPEHTQRRLIYYDNVLKDKKSLLIEDVNKMTQFIGK